MIRKILKPKGRGRPKPYICRIPTIQEVVEPSDLSVIDFNDSASEGDLDSISSVPSATSSSL